GRKRYGHCIPLEFRAGWLNFVVVSNPEHIITVFKSSKWLSSKPATIFSLKNLLATPPDVIPFYEADDSGMAGNPRKESKMEQKNRIHYWQAITAQKFLSGQHLVHLSNRYLTTLHRNLESLSIGEDWVDMPDLYNFLQRNVTRAAIESIMGSKILEMNPTLVEDFWNFDNCVPKFLRGLPRWLIPSAYKNRDNLLRNIKKWHEYAHKHSDCTKTGIEDPEWDPYFGFKLVRARQDYALKMDFMSADARASEDLGLLFASNANVLPAVFWLLFEALKDPDLHNRMLQEVTTCASIQGGGFDITKLSEQPLLQSSYAEVLRIRVAITMTRVNEFEDFTLAGYRIPRHKPIVIFSRTSALNEEAWVQAGREITKPLDEFHAERFLIHPKTHDREREKKKKVGISDNIAPKTNLDDRLQFSLDGLAGCWIPYGGGQRMCPGRHFAKNEILGTFALLCTKYDIELQDMDTGKVQSDFGWYPVGSLPPVCKVPFRIRMKSACTA
ncbi:cytochrome P450, partial [Delitschia confertaspora ATCC 74209]